MYLQRINYIFSLCKRTKNIEAVYMIPLYRDATRREIFHKIVEFKEIAWADELSFLCQITLKYSL